MKKKSILIFVFLLSINSVYAFDFTEDTTFNFPEEKVTNITQIFNNITINGTDLFLNNLTDVQVPSPADGESLVWDSGIMKWISETVISRWIVSTTNGFLYNNSDTIFFNDTKLNDTIDARAAAANNDFKVFINASAYNNIIYNITAGDADDVGFVIEPGKKFIFGEIFT